MDDTAKTTPTESQLPFTSDEVWSHMETQLNDFHDIIFYTRAETLEEAVGKKTQNGKFVSTAPRMDEPESNSRMVHAGVIPFASQQDIEFLDLALPLTQKYFCRVRELVKHQEMTRELLFLWGQLSHYCGRIESYWALDSEKISHRRGGESNKELSCTEAHKVWFSQMLKLVQSKASDRGEIESKVIEEIRFRQNQKNQFGFQSSWYSKFFNGKGHLSSAFTDKKLYKSVLESHAKNPNRLDIPEVIFLSTPAIASAVKRD